MPITRRAAIISGLATPSLALAQSRFPDKPLRVFVPWTPGGATDIQMRMVCEVASRHLGQPVIVENKPGASGTLGAQAVAREARPDGYTLSQMPNGVFRLPAMMRAQGMTPPFDPMQDFTWVLRMVGYLVNGVIGVILSLILNGILGLALGFSGAFALAMVITPVVGFLCALVPYGLLLLPERKGLHDMIAKSLVIRVDR